MEKGTYVLILALGDGGQKEAENHLFRPVAMLIAREITLVGV